VLSLEGVPGAAREGSSSPQASSLKSGQCSVALRGSAGSVLRSANHGDPWRDRRLVAGLRRSIRYRGSRARCAKRASLPGAHNRSGATSESLSRTERTRNRAECARKRRERRVVRWPRMPSESSRAIWLRTQHLECAGALGMGRSGLGSHAGCARCEIFTSRTTSRRLSGDLTMGCVKCGMLRMFFLSFAYARARVRTHTRTRIHARTRACAGGRGKHLALPAGCIIFW
jgi:hypothetical protein